MTNTATAAQIDALPRLFGTVRDLAAAPHLTDAALDAELADAERERRAARRTSPAYADATYAVRALADEQRRRAATAA